MLMDVLFFMSYFIKPNIFEDNQEKLKFRKFFLYMFRPKSLKFIAMTVINFELNFLAGF